MVVSLTTCIMMIVLSVSTSFWIAWALHNKHPNVLNVLGEVGRIIVTGYILLLGVIALVIIVTTGISY